MLSLMLKTYPLNLPNLLQKLDINNLFNLYWRKDELKDVKTIVILTNAEEIEQFYKNNKDLLYRDTCAEKYAAVKQNKYYLQLFVYFEHENSIKVGGYIYVQRLLQDFLIDYLCSVQKTIGSFLMTLVILIAKEINIQNIKLSSISSTYKFYLKFGFKNHLTKQVPTYDDSLILNVNDYTQERIEQLKKNQGIEFQN